MTVEDLILEASERVLEVFEKTPLQALDEARKALIDTVSVAAAAPAFEDAVKAYVEDLFNSSGESLVLGLWRGAPPVEAAAANAAFAHALELDDWLAPAYVHAGSVVVPVALSLAAGWRLEDVLRLVVAGYEAAYQIGYMLGRSHYKLWHATATAGAAAAAATAFIALAGGSASPEGVASAIELALSYAGGLWSAPKGDPLYKPLSPMIAVVKGISAAKAARVVGKRAPLPGVFCDVLKAGCMLPGEEKPGIMRNGLKFYPACRHTHTAIEAAEAISEKLRDRSRISLVEVKVYDEAARVASIEEPHTPNQLRFSLKCLVATALTYGKVGLREIYSAYRDPEVLKVCARVKIIVDQEFTKAYPEEQPAEVRVITESGKVLTKRISIPRGDPGRGSSVEDVLSKARDLARDSGDSLIAELALRIRDAGLDERLNDILKMK